MVGKVVLVVCVLLTLSSANLIQPRDLVDEAQEQLQELMSLIQGDILAAHDDLNYLASDYQYYLVMINRGGLIDIRQEHDNIDAQVSTVVDLAISAGYDVTSCTLIREQVLDNLPGQYSAELNACLQEVNEESAKLLSDARYIVDVVINKVHDLSNQLRNCREDILCISPVLTEIQLNKVRLPQNIQTEVQNAENLISLLRLSLQSCADTKVSEYVAQASAILSDIVACVDGIIG